MKITLGFFILSIQLPRLSIFHESLKLVLDGEREKDDWHTHPSPNPKSAITSTKTPKTATECTTKECLSTKIHGPSTTRQQYLEFASFQCEKKFSPMNKSFEHHTHHSDHSKASFFDTVHSITILLHNHHYHLQN